MDKPEADIIVAQPGVSRRHLLVSSVLSGAALAGAGSSWAQAVQALDPAAAPIPDWTAADTPSQTGRTIVVTGGNGVPDGDRSGLGYHTALELTRAGGNVIIASRNADRGAEAVRRMKDASPGATVRFEPLDLADFASIRAFAGRLEAREQRIDTLVNNAATMGRLQRETSADGHERVFATNALGHFALTAQLAPLLRRGRSPRVVFVSSKKANGAAIRFDDLQALESYDQDFAYSQSKLASLLLAFELQRRSDRGGWGIASLAAHPGVARTSLIPDGPGLGPDSRPGQNFRDRPEMFQPAAIGALPTLYAATTGHGGHYYGPRDASELRGLPARAGVPQAARDMMVARQLWQVAERLTGDRLG